MKDFQPIIDTLQAALLQRMGDEVDLIFQYGSHLKGTAHQYSDVDISWVPVHATTRDAITVMVDHTLCDLYPIHWARLEQMAEYRDVSATVLLSSRIVYQRTEAAADRFHGLSAQLRALLEADARPAMVRRALEIFQGAGYDFYLLREQAARGHQIGCLQQAHAVLRTVLHCLAVCNQQCIDTRKLAQVPLNLSLGDTFANGRRRIAYERMLLDVLTNNSALFLRRDEVEAAWQLIDGIIEGWKSTVQKASP